MGEREEVFRRLAASIREAVTWSMDGRAPHIDYTRITRFKSRACSEPTWDSWNQQFVRCRRCQDCRHYRRSVWVARMVREITREARTWFVTLTFKPGETFDYSAVQRWLKRVRQVLPPGARIRYVCTAEQGSLHGRSHYHLVLHGPLSVRWRHLCHTWQGGFSSAKLVKQVVGAARYVAKYLTKEGNTVRASTGYGAEKGSLSNEGENATALSPSDRITIDTDSREAEGERIDNPDERGGSPPTRVSLDQYIVRQWTGYQPVCAALWLPPRGAQPCYKRAARGRLAWQS